MPLCNINTKKTSIFWPSSVTSRTVLTFHYPQFETDPSHWFPVISSVFFKQKFPQRKRPKTGCICCIFHTRGAVHPTVNNIEYSPHFMTRNKFNNGTEIGYGRKLNYTIPTFSVSYVFLITQMHQVCKYSSEHMHCALILIIVEMSWAKLVRGLDEGVLIVFLLPEGW